MDVRVLQYFLALAREQTISGAAETLHMTQPPLSKQLKELEDELGKQLFIRGNRKITLTKEGLLLRKRAEEIISLVEKTKAEVSSTNEAISGEVYIGGGESEGVRPIAKTIHTIQRQYPNVHFHYFSGDGYDVSERLDRGLIDFGILIEPIDIKKYDSLRLPGADVWGLLMRKDSPLAAQKVIRPNDLCGIPLISARQLAKENSLSGWLGYSYEKLRVVATGNLINNLCLLAEESVGYVIAIDRLVKHAEESMLCFRPFEPKITSGMYLVWKQYQVFSTVAELFLDKLKETIADADGGGHDKI